jgi:hypothetical protein
LDLAGGTALTIRRLIVPLTVAVFAGAAPTTSSAFEGGPAPASQAGLSDDCMKEFAPLREEAEQRGKLIKVASERHGPPDEACKLIGNFGQAEIKMIRYVQTNASRCGIPPQISDQLMSGHRNTESMQKKVCAVAQQQQRGPSGPTGDFWILPEKQL